MSESLRERLNEDVLLGPDVELTGSSGSIKAQVVAEGQVLFVGDIEGFSWKSGEVTSIRIRVSLGSCRRVLVEQKELSVHVNMSEGQELTWRCLISSAEQFEISDLTSISGILTVTQ